MWVLIGAVFAAVRILAVNSRQQRHNDHKEHQRRNCSKEKSNFIAAILSILFKRNKQLYLIQNFI